MIKKAHTQPLVNLSDVELMALRVNLDQEMSKRKLAFTVGEIGEQLAIQHFKSTSGLPALQLAPTGTKNVDALSREGDRYSVKTLLKAKKTGTIYPDSENQDKQLFEFLLIVRLKSDWSLHSIYQFTWADFIEVRSWDKTMNAWYIGASLSTLKKARIIMSSD